MPPSFFLVQVVANMEEAARNPYFQTTFTEPIRKPPSERPGG